MYRNSLLTALLSYTAFFADAAPSVCDKYTQAIFGADTPTNQYALITVVINTAAIGNYTKPNVGITVPGFLAPAVYEGENVNLLPYFNGCLKDANRNGAPVAINFLDGGGAAALKQSKPANDQSSNQYLLFTHLYEFFGKLLGCSGYGQPGFPVYMGVQSQYQVHKFMNLDHAQVGYFNYQVGLAAQSLGVSSDDVSAIVSSLMKLFNYRCSPPVAITDGPVLQSICNNEKCPLDPQPVCDKYQKYPNPQNVCGNGGWGNWGKSG